MFDRLPQQFDEHRPAVRTPHRIQQQLKSVDRPAVIQAIAERWVQAAAVVPNARGSAGAAAAWKALKLPGTVPSWVLNLRGKELDRLVVALRRELGAPVGDRGVDASHEVAIGRVEEFEHDAIRYGSARER